LTAGDSPIILPSVKFAKIQFESADDRVRAVADLMQRAKVVALREGVFIVPEPALEGLIAQRVSYRVLQWLNQDDVLQALRNNLAHPV
jgi:hypothetical protein